jgi:DNA polymerase
VKCRPPDNRDPEPDEIAACYPYLRRQLEALDPALVVTLGRHSMGRFMPGARISQAHGTVRPADPGTGAPDALVYAMYHPAAALRSAEVERTSFEDVAGVPTALLDARRQRAERTAGAAARTTDPHPQPPTGPPADSPLAAANDVSAEADTLHAALLDVATDGGGVPVRAAATSGTGQDDQLTMF